VQSKQFFLWPLKMLEKGVQKQPDQGQGALIAVEKQEFT
jgi:hypothetical protein